MNNRRFARLTNAFSKKIENHAHSVALMMTYYNFVRIHQTLRVKPAMAAGVTDRLWEIGDIVALMDAAEPKTAKRGPYKKRDEMGWFASLRTWARDIRRDVVALYFAARDPRVPWYAKVAAAAVAAYTLSPIDLIPDFIPVLGYVDEILVLPFGIMLAVKLIPPEIMAEHRAAAIRAEGKPKSRAAALVIVMIWIAAAAWLAWLFWRSRTS